jgi:hypothetical protein
VAPRGETHAAGSLGNRAQGGQRGHAGVPRDAAHDDKVRLIFGWRQKILYEPHLICMSASRFTLADFERVKLDGHRS